MAVITLDYTNTLKETAANDGTVEGSVVITLAESTFAGTNAEALTGATVSNVPAGLTAVLVKTDDTHATLTFTGKATAHDADISNLTVTLTAASFDSGADLTDVNLVKDNLLIDFDAPAGGGSEPPAPFSGPLFIASVEELAAGAGGDPTIGTAGKVKLTGYAATPGSTITIFNGSKKVDGTVTLNATTGVWTFETPSLDKAGVYNFTAKETFIDNSGTSEKTLYGGPSNTLTYTVDTKAPPAPKVDKFKLPTADTTPTITGKAEKFAEVEVFAKLGEAAATSLGKVQANDKGIWSLQVEDALAEGTYALTAEATDAAGNKNTVAGKAETLTIDTSVAAFSITAEKGLKYSDGDAKVWATKALATQKLEGKAEANSVIHFFGGPDGSVPLGKPVKVNKTGDWKATIKLTDGEHVISAVIIDQAGNISASQPVGTIKVDAFAPIATVKKETATPTTLSGLVEHDAVEVEVFAGKTSLGKVTTGLEDGTWELAVPDSVKGKQKITVTAKDAAGNVSKPSAGVTYDFTEAAGGDSTPPTISEFIVASATTLTLKSNEAGKAGLYNDDGGALIGTEVTLVKDTTSPAITVAAQTSMTIASLKVADAVPNTATSTTKVLLGTAGGDGGATFTVGAGDQYIFTFAGNDTITFTSAAASGRVIADFTAGGDKIALTGTAFAGITADSGLLQAADFASGDGKVAAASATELIIYDTATGNLYYDAGGNTGGSADAVLIAKLVGAPTVAETDFLVV